MQMGPGQQMFRRHQTKVEWQKPTSPGFVSWTLDLIPDSLTRVRGSSCLVRSLMCLAYYRPDIGAGAKTIIAFQCWVSIVFAAWRNGPGPCPVEFFSLIR